MIRGAIFDADGTLLDSMGMWDTLGIRYLASLGIDALPGLRADLFPMTQAEASVYLQKTYRLGKTPQEIEDGINAAIRDFYRHEVNPKPGARAFLEELRRQGVAITLATNTARAAIVDGLLRADLLPLLDEIYTCGELGTGKDQPWIFHKARDRMGTRTEDTWVFEDAVHCARTAWDAGYKVAGVSDPFSDQDQLKQLCHLYLPDLTDFPAFYEKAAAF